MLCLLSLVFGGLLWPIAWLWAYTRPVGYQARLRHREARRLLHRAGREGARAASCCEHEIDAPARRARRDGRRKGALPPELKRLREDLELARAAGAARRRAGRRRARRSA